MAAINAGNVILVGKSMLIKVEVCYDILATERGGGEPGKNFTTKGSGGIVFWFESNGSHKSNNNHE